MSPITVNKSMRLLLAALAALGVLTLLLLRPLLVATGIPKAMPLQASFTRQMTESGRESKHAVSLTHLHAQTATIFYFYSTANPNVTVARAMAPPLADTRHVAIGLDGAWRSPADLDARTLFPAAQERAYQRLLCEASGNLAVANNLDALAPPLAHHAQRPRWIGSVSIKRPLPAPALDALERFYLTEARADTLFSWVTAFSMPHDLTAELVRGHELSRWAPSHVDLRALIDAIVHEELGIPRGAFRTALPSRYWSYKQALLMSTHVYSQYMCFVRAFITGLLKRFYSPSERRQRYCFLKAEFGREELCWAFLLERLPNYWAYNAGYRLFGIPGVDRGAAETLALMRWAESAPYWQTVPPAYHNESDPVRRTLRACHRPAAAIRSGRAGARHALHANQNAAHGTGRSRTED